LPLSGSIRVLRGPSAFDLGTAPVPHLLEHVERLTVIPADKTRVDHRLPVSGSPPALAGGSAIDYFFDQLHLGKHPEVVAARPDDTFSTADSVDDVPGPFCRSAASKPIRIGWAIAFS
jgi:hypothetical protein